MKSRHATFITKRLAIAFGALAVAPFFLAFHGAPTMAQAFAFAWCFAPLAAAMLVARTGNLAAGHVVAAFGLAGLALTLVGVFGYNAACAIVFFAAAQLEAAQSHDRRLQLGFAFCSALCVAALIALLGRSSAAGLPSAAADQVVAALALAYGAIVLVDVPREAVTPRQSPDAAMWAASMALTDEFIVGFDATGSVVGVPKSDLTLAGTAARDLGGRGLFELVHVADRPAFLKLVGDAAHGETPSPIRIRLRVAQTPQPARPERPRHTWFEMKARRADVEGVGTDLSVVGSLRDAEALSALDSEIAAAQSSIEEAIRSKDHFLASMSHELRTPLNAIIGFSEMLASHTLRPADQEKQREYARIIHQSGQHLLSVVNSILDMSKIRSGTFAILPEPFDVVPLLDLSCDMIALKAEEGRIDLVRDYPSGLEQLVGDKRACKQILINLLSNAVKFTPEGGSVTLSARPEGNTLAIAVGDTGIGIGAADLARLGDPFFQARSSLSRPFEGTGLGLSVVRGLVGLHGGTIELESELGRGTHVKVRLPLDCRTAGEAGSTATIETLPRRRTHEPVVHFDRREKQIA